REIADDVEHFMPHEFLLIPQRLIGEHGIVADHHGIFEAAAPDESVRDEIFNLFVETKGAGVGEFALPSVGGKLEAVKLREASLLVRAGAGYFEHFVRE